MTNSSKQSTLNTAASLRKASVYIFLVVCACLVLVAGQLTVEEMMSAYPRVRNRFMARLTTNCRPAIS